MSQTTFTRPINDVLVRLTLPHTVGDGVLTVGDTSSFGSITPTSPVRVTVRNGLNNTLAIYKVTSVTATQLLINSAIENTTDISFPAQSQVTVDFTAGHLQDAYTAINALEVKPDHITIGSDISGGLWGGVLYQSGVGTLAQDTGLVYNGFDDTLSVGNIILSGNIDVKGIPKNILFVDGSGYLEQNDVGLTWDYATHTFGIQAKSGQTENALEVKNFAGTVVCRITPTGSVYGDGSNLTGVEKPSNKGIASGYASLDSGGKIPTSQLPASILGAVSYQGTWNASANSPTLVSGVGTKGFYYKVSVAGTTSIDGNASWALGDWIVFDGVVWEQVNSHDAVVSVNGMTGAVTGLVQLSGAQIITGLKTFQAANGSTKGLVVQGSTSQTANFIDCIYSNNSPAFTIDVNGVVSTIGCFMANGTGGFNSTVPQQGLTLATSSVGNSWQIFGDNNAGFYAGTNGLAIRYGSGTAALQVASSGNRVGFNVHPVANQQLTVLSSDTATKNLVLQASPSQTANLTEWQDSTGVVGLSVDKNCYLNGTNLNNNTFIKTSGTNVGFIGNSTAWGDATTGQLAIASYTTNLRFYGGGSAVPGCIVGNGNTSIPVLYINPAGTNYGFLGKSGSWLGTGDANFIFASFQPSLYIATNNATSVSLSVNPNGLVGINTGTSTPVAQLEIDTHSSSTLGLVVKGFTSQTANLTEWQDGTTTVLAKTTKDGVQVAKGFATSITNKTAAYTITVSDGTITSDATLAAFAVTLPAANGVPSGRIFVIKKMDSSANAVTVTAAGSDTIDGSGTYVLSARWNSVTVQSDGVSVWYIIAKI